MMMTCRLLCALLVLALCCYPSVCAAEPTEHTEVKAAVAASSQSPPSVPRKEIGNSGSPSNGSGVEKGITAVAGLAPTAAGLESGDVSNTVKIIVLTVLQDEKSAQDNPQKKQVRKPKILPRRLRRRLQQWHQLRLQRRQRQRPPAHRHVFANSKAASAALRGCLPRCCLPYPR
ncbi:mucin TcMUCII [Trypanosoma cruzi cruzi]|nr:mucin TcMUCII [Trypanosoma cruzi cruzi]